MAPGVEEAQTHFQKPDRPAAHGRNRLPRRFVHIVTFGVNVPWYFHGRLMVERRTSGMAVGSALRVIGIYFGAMLFFNLGWLNHITASLLLIMGFLIETAVVIQAAVNGKGVRKKATANR